MHLGDELGKDLEVVNTKHVIWLAITFYIKVVIHKRRGVEVKVNEPCCENDRVVDSRNLIGWSRDRSHLSEAESLSSSHLGQLKMSSDF